MRPIAEIADSMGLEAEHVIPYGRHKAKISLEAIREGGPRGKLIVVTGMTPTRAGEGKTTTTVGLAQGLGRLGQSVAATLREPSLGPIFGIKGGGTGGGEARVEPEDEVNIHFTGDAHAVGSAHNLLAALTDNVVQRGQIEGFNPLGISWRRVTDVEDRALRDVVAGVGGSPNAPMTETGFDIVTASEIMAVLALTSGLADLRARLSRVVVGFTDGGRPVTAEEINAVGSMMSLLRYAIQPNLVQTSEGQPVIVHTGPFGNIAHGCSSVVGDRLALGYADYVLTEAGFGADLGFEKFMNIKARYNDLEPSGAVLVASAKALKSHGGVRDRDLDEPNVEALRAGAPNLEHLVGVVTSMGLPVVVAINRFPSDTEEELAAVKELAEAAGAHSAVEIRGFAEGGAGGVESGGGVDGRHQGRSADHRVLLLAGGLHTRQDARPGQERVQRRQRPLEPRGAATAPELREPGLGRPAGVHGQDKPVHLAQPQAQGSAFGLHLPDFRRQGVRGRRLHLPHRRQHRHHARPSRIAEGAGRGRRGKRAGAVVRTGPPASGAYPSSQDRGSDT